MNLHAKPAPDAVALARLAARFGIALEFTDALGREVSTRPETCQNLLATMGVAANDASEASEMLRALETADETRVLPPVVVLRPLNGDCAVDLNLRGETERVEWRVLLEDGSVLAGVAEPDALKENGQGRRLVLRDLPFGYHRLELPGPGASTTLIISPGTCWLPSEAGSGLWGIAVQLYLLRSDGNWGIGDFSDLRRLVELASARRCAVIGLNPLHQMFLDDPEHASPYSPATRLFLNPLYIDVTAVPEFSASEEATGLVDSKRFQLSLAAARSAPLVDYSSVTALKIEALQAAFRTFTSAGLPARRRAFETFCAEQGESLSRASLFQVLRQHFSSEPNGRNWRTWPEELQDVASQATHQFAEDHSEEIGFQSWLQFLADEQLGHAAEAARSGGMSIGLYRDLAVGCDSLGAETWASPSAFLHGAAAGAPPDIYNPAGQDWGLPPFHPAGLAEEGYRSFAELIRANMRHAGGLRIDHVMGLSRLYCIPEGASPAEGAYVSYPLDDLLGVLELESTREQCLVVGEDLGTVPPGFREKLAAGNILSYRVLFFEQDSNTGVYVPPGDYPELALAVTGSHDLPTLIAWWEGGDIEIKEKLGRYPSEDEVTAQQERRARDRRMILEAFTAAGLLTELPEIESVSAALFSELAHAFLAMTPSAIIATQLDDMTGDAEPVNIPGTSTEHPNWRRKYGMTLEDLASNEAAWSLAKSLARG